MESKKKTNTRSRTKSKTASPAPKEAPKAAALPRHKGVAMTVKDGRVLVLQDNGSIIQYDQMMKKWMPYCDAPGK